ncbi:MAG: hypothetical protein WBC60_15545 [Cognaticolwellia sp.]
MNTFKINRIDTSLGIFRISGMWSSESLADLITGLESIEMMGSDGWCLLDLSNDDVHHLIKTLAPSLLAHLQN